MRISPSRRRATVVAASLLTLICLGLSGQALAKKSTKTVNASPTLKALVNQTRGLPTAAASSSRKALLLRTARHAARVAKRRPCKAVADLAAYRRLLRGTKIRGSVKGRRLKARMRLRLAKLGPASLKASRKLLSDKRTKRCGGGVDPVAAEVRQDDRPLRATRTACACASSCPRLDVLRADAAAARAGPSCRCRTARRPGADGEPGIPVVSSIVRRAGRRQGRRSTPARPSRTRSTASTCTRTSRTSVDLGSNDPQPNFLKRPVREQAVHDRQSRLQSRTGSSRPAPADGQVLGQARDVTIGGLQIPAVQYDAAHRKLKVLNTVDVSVKFDGGPKTFSDELGSPWERSQRTLISSLLNKNVVIVEARLHPAPLRRGDARHHQPGDARRGRPVRDRQARAGLAHERLPGRRRGRARSAPRAAQIQAFIRSQLTALLLHPPELRHDHRRRRPRADVHGRARRDPVRPEYSLKTDADELPDVAIGRIIGNDQTAVANAVDEDPRLRDDRADRQRDAQQGARRRAVPGRRQRRAGEPHVHPVRRDRPQRARRARRRGRPRLRREPRQQPAALQRRHAAAGGAAEADVRMGRHRRAGQRRRGTRAASWSSTATTAGRTAGARRATARPTCRRSPTARCCRSC